MSRVGVLYLECYYDVKLDDLKVKKLVIRGRKEIFSGPYQR